MYDLTDEFLVDCMSLLILLNQLELSQAIKLDAYLHGKIRLVNSAI